MPAGTYNVVDDVPLTGRELADAFAAAFGTKRLFLTPAWVLRLLRSPAGSMLASQRVSNARFRELTGWEPAYPSAREGWRAIASARSHVTDGGGSR